MQMLSLNLYTTTVIREFKIKIPRPSKMKLLWVFSAARVDVQLEESGYSGSVWIWSSSSTTGARCTSQVHCLQIRQQSRSSSYKSEFKGALIQFGHPLQHVTCFWRFVWKGKNCSRKRSSITFASGKHTLNAALQWRCSKHKRKQRVDLCRSNAYDLTTQMSSSRSCYYQEGFGNMWATQPWRFA